MITKPLDLSSRLRPLPRSMDAIFYANVVLIGLFFAFFGSKFVLAPGVELSPGDFALPQSGAATAGSTHTTAVISVLSSGIVFTDAGRMNFAELAAWLPSQLPAEGGGAARLLIRADAHVSLQDLMRLSDLARKAGFQGVQTALEPMEAR